MYLYIHTYIYAHVNEVYKHSHQAARYPLIIVDHHWSRWNPLTVTNLSWQRSWGTEWQRANQQYQYRELPRPCRSESGPDSPSSPTIVAVAVEIFWTPNWDQFWTTGKWEICFVLCGKLGLGTRKFRQTMEFEPRRNTSFGRWSQSRRFATQKAAAFSPSASLTANP